MTSMFDRTIALIGVESFEKLQSAHVLVVGLGGVGGAVAEVLARSGVGKLTLVDGDNFEITNLNRQILCTVHTVNKNKAVAAVERVSTVIGCVSAVAIPEFVTKDNVQCIVDRGYNYCVDAIDDADNKVLLISECNRCGINIVSAMGAGNRIDCDFCVTDIYKTKNDPFARKLRGLLRKSGVSSLDVVCATSPPLMRAGTPASIAAPPLVMGALIANHVIKKLIA